MFTLIADVIANNILLFRILGSILIFILFWTLKSPVTKLIIKLLDKLLNRKRQIADHSTLTFVLTPLKSFFAASGIYLALVNLNPSAGMEHFLLKVYRISVIIIVTWILLRLCDCASDSFFRFGNKLDEQLDVNLNKTLMTFLKKALKVLLIVLAAIAILSETGTNVTTIITGLGLGGLTFALQHRIRRRTSLAVWSSCWTNRLRSMTGFLLQISRALSRTSPSAPPASAPSRTLWWLYQTLRWCPPPLPTGPE